MGGFIETGFTFLSSDIDKLCMRGELGIEMTGEAVLYNSDVSEASKDTEVYERFKDSSVALDAFVKASAQAKCGSWGNITLADYQTVIS